MVVWGHVSLEQTLDELRPGSYNFRVSGSEVNSSPAVLRLGARILAKDGGTAAVRWDTT